MKYIFTLALLLAVSFGASAKDCSGHCLSIVESGNTVVVTVTDSFGSVIEVETAHIARRGKSDREGLVAVYDSADLIRMARSKNGNYETIMLPDGGSVTIIKQSSYDIVVTQGADGQIKDVQIVKKD